MSLSTHEIRSRLRARYAENRGIDRHAFFEEVANGTGWKAKRWIDAVAIELWPSDGNHIHAFEIKASRSDWLKELDSPGKAKPFEECCDFFWLVVGAKSIVGLEEVPDGWGLMIPSGKGLRIAKRAVKKKLESAFTGTLDFPFALALLRSASRNSATKAALKSAKREGFEEGKEYSKVEVEIAEKERDVLRKSIAEFEAASGVTISSWRAGDVGRAVKLVQEMGRDNYDAGRLKSLGEKLIQTSEDLAGLFSRGET